MSAPRVEVRAIDLFERATPLRIPFKFGASTLTEAPQVFVRAEVVIDGRSATGQAAELLAPKWFDKNPALTNQQNFDQLRASLAGARRLYLDHGAAASAFALHAAVYPVHYAEAARAGLNGLIASYGMALIDRAVLDALCRVVGDSVFDAVRANRPGITTELTPDLRPDALAVFLATRQLPAMISARHTVGMADPLTDAEIAAPLNDGLPQSLEAVIAAYGNRYFKIKVGADIDASVAPSRPHRRDPRPHRRRLPRHHGRQRAVQRRGACRRALRSHRGDGGSSSACGRRRCSSNSRSGATAR